MPSAAPLVRLLESHYKDVRTLKATFLETYRDGRSGVQIESGTVYFSRPGRMRWEYESPESKLFVSDGKTVWFYVPADKTVTRSPMKESDDWRTPLALLTGKVKLSQLCQKVEMLPEPPTQPGVAVLQCVPKGADAKTRRDDQAGGDSLLPSSYDRVLLDVNSASGEIAAVRIEQSDGVHLEFRFGRWEQGLPVADVLFHFQPPPGTALVDDSIAH